MRAFSASPIAEPVARVMVTVTFLAMDTPPLSRPPALPGPLTLTRVERPTLGFYRYLYNTVGAAHCWWLRRAMPDHELAALIGDPLVTIDVLYFQGEPAGFFELDHRVRGTANISYFGLFPHMLGRGVGPAFLRAAVDAAWAAPGVRSVTVNTCTADHPRAMPTYIAAGFRPMRQMREVWSIPLRLGLSIPEHIKAAL